MIASAAAQEQAGQAEISLQQYYLSIDSQRVSNILGLGINFTQFIPNTGLLTGNLLPALSNGRFRNGESYVQLKGLPWKGYHWTFTAGDFRVRGQLLAVPFSNINFPEIDARGVAVEAIHGSQTIGFFYGQETLSSTPQVVLRELVPQRVSGLYWRQAIGTRLLLGARVMHYSNDLVALSKLTTLLTQTPFSEASTASISSLYTVAGALKLYGEATWSMTSQPGLNLATRNVPVSTLVGPIFDTKWLTIRANYTFQNESYFPLLGYYLGDRAGPYVEVRYLPFSRLELYGSASEYENNVARNPTLPDFRNSNESAGASVQLPGKISVTAQFTELSLVTRVDAQSPWLTSAYQQKTLTLARQFARHNFRFTVRDFRDVSLLDSQRQRSVEVEENFHVHRLTLGGGIRMQWLTATESRASLFYRGSAQFSLRRFSMYANLENGNDLLNRSLLATNTVSTTSLGASASLGKDWQIRAEAYRNNLLTELNPQSIFVLQGQGVSIPGTVAALNQWSLAFRLIWKIRWGNAGPIDDLSKYAALQAPLRGSVEGYVMEGSGTDQHPVEGVTVSIDQARTSMTDADGHYRFADVPEGAHKASLARFELPAEYEFGSTTESRLVVLPSKPSRANFEVVRLASIQGTVKAPKDSPVETVVIRMSPGGQYTTPDTDGHFSFYNLRAGQYTITVDEKTLPEFGVLTQPGSASVTVQFGLESAPVSFGFEIHKPDKPVRNVLEKK